MWNFLKKEEEMHQGTRPIFFLFGCMLSTPEKWHWGIIYDNNTLFFLNKRDPLQTYNRNDIIVFAFTSIIRNEVVLKRREM